MWLPTLLYLAIISLVTSLRMQEPPPPTPATRNVPQERWFRARMDHFHASNTDRFEMRFYYNNEFGGTEHILIFVGGEWEISPNWLQGGLMYELASELNATMFYTEHRYYGKTRPTENTSVRNLRYLTVDQSLADLAQFIEHVRSDQFEGGKYRNATVGLVGCSFAGTMATWMQLAYPHLVDVAFSDSGPLQAQEDFPEYLEMITEALRSQGSEECVNSVQEGMQGLTQMLQNDAGRAQVSSMFRTCAPMTSSPLDHATLSWFGVTETFAHLVQNNATPGVIASACNQLTDPDVANPTQRLADLVTSFPWNQPCLEARYTKKVESHTETSYGAYDSPMRLWTYQSCVEFGWFQTTNSNRQPFLSSVPLEFFHQMCKDFFSTYFDEARLRSGIRRTNILFGGLTYMPDDVISVVGAADPWSPMGPGVSQETARSPVYVVDGVSHCRAIRSSEAAESSELRSTMNAVKSFMYKRVTGNDRPSVDNGAVIQSVTFVTIVMAFVTAVL